MGQKVFFNFVQIQPKTINKLFKILLRHRQKRPAIYHQSQFTWNRGMIDLRLPHRNNKHNLSWIQKKCFPILANMYISLKLEDLWVHEKKFHHYSNGIIHITYHQYTKNGILLPKLFWPTVKKKYFGDQEKLLKV